MAQPARHEELDEGPPVGSSLDEPSDEIPIDPDAIERRYRLERARRRAREQRRQETTLARFRFYAVMLLLVLGSVGLLVLVWQQIQRLFGL
jgi:hypothetical protein